MFLLFVFVTMKRGEGLESDYLVLTLTNSWTGLHHVVISVRFVRWVVHIVVVDHIVGHDCLASFFMKRKSKQWWSTILPISTKLSKSIHHIPLNTTKLSISIELIPLNTTKLSISIHHLPLNTTKLSISIHHIPLNTTKLSISIHHIPLNTKNNTTYEIGKIQKEAQQCGGIWSVNGIPTPPTSANWMPNDSTNI
jgi:hypothetical protein